MDLRQLQCLVAVAHHEHITRAAEALHLTQSAVSQHLLRLEAEFGVRLFDRGPHGTVPTSAGQDLLTHARAILGAVDGARAAMTEHRGEAAAAVRLLAEPYAVPGLAEAVVDAVTLEPRMTAGLREASTADVLDAVRRGAADLGFVALAGPAPPGLEVHPLAVDPLVVLCPLADRQPSTRGLPERLGDDLGGLRGRAVLLPGRGTAARLAADAAFSAVDFSPLPRFEVSSPALARHVVGAGLAAGVVPASWADGADVRAQLVHGAAPVRPVLVHRGEPAEPLATLVTSLRDALG